MNNLFTSSPSVQSSRILYTPSPFARSSLLHLQEVGSLTAIKPHTSKREKLQSYLCFMVEDGEGELVYEGKKKVYGSRPLVLNRKLSQVHLFLWHIQEARVQKNFLGQLMRAVLIT